MIGISRGTPRWSLPFRYRKLPALAPDAHTWAQEDQQEFEASYVRQLNVLGTETILSDLERIARNGSAVLLCWEVDPGDPETPCHRRYLARFLECEAGIVVPELHPGDLPAREDAVETRMF